MESWEYYFFGLAGSEVYKHTAGPELPFSYSVAFCFVTLRVHARTLLCYTDSHMQGGKSLTF